MATEKQSRKELLEEPDPVTVTLHRIAAFFVAYHKPIIGGVAVLLLVVASVSGYFYYQHQRETAASELFARGMSNYQAVVAEGGTDEQFETVKQGFRHILDDYGNTSVADLALVQYAATHYKSGDFEGAVTHYEKALDRLGRDHTFREMAVNGLAYSYEALGDYESAIIYFEMVADDPGSATRDQALFKLGELYAATGDPEKSQGAYEEIVTTHTDSMYFEIAKDRLRG